MVRRGPAAACVALVRKGQIEAARTFCNRSCRAPFPAGWSRRTAAGRAFVRSRRRASSIPVRRRRDMPPARSRPPRYSPGARLCTVRHQTVGRIGLVQEVPERMTLQRVQPRFTEVGSNHMRHGYATTSAPCPGLCHGSISSYESPACPRRARRCIACARGAWR